MMDSLLSHFAEQMRRRKDESEPTENVIEDGLYFFFIINFIVIKFFNFYCHFLETNPIQSNGIGVLSNKFSRLTLATFDDEGRCIGQMGSLTISY